MRSSCRRGGLSALVAVAVVLAACSSRSTPPPTQTATSLVAVAPSGAASWPVAFEWTSDAQPNTVFTVLLLDEAQRELLRASARGRRWVIDLTPDQPLKTGGTFYWQVAILGDAGTPVRESAHLRFTLPGQ